MNSNSNSTHTPPVAEQSSHHEQSFIRHHCHQLKMDLALHSCIRMLSPMKNVAQFTTPCTFDKQEHGESRKTAVTYTADNGSGGGGESGCAATLCKYTRRACCLSSSSLSHQPVYLYTIHASENGCGCGCVVQCVCMCKQMMGKIGKLSLAFATPSVYSCSSSRKIVHAGRTKTLPLSPCECECSRIDGA